MEKKIFASILLRSLVTPNYFEQKAANLGLPICGIDEVGRGPLAGPIIAAAVILKPMSRYPRDLTDSKALSPQERERMFAWIQKNAMISIGILSGRRIDDMSISVANCMVMQKALSSLIARYQVVPACVLVDAVPLSIPWLYQIELPEDVGPWHDDPFVHPWNKVVSFYQGETKSRSIAAASIVAKVFRDRLMVELSEIYPRYYFARHKGYATQLHQQQLQAEGYSILHRKSFLKNFMCNNVQLSFIDAQE